MAHDVFVSYSNKDKAIADSIVAAMESNQIRCWYTPRDVKPGQDWGEAIAEAIENCRVFLVIFSSNANRSQRVLDEVNLAIDSEAVLVPFRIENLKPKGALKLHLSSRHWLDAFDPSWESHIEQLIQEVSANLDTKIKRSDIKVPNSILNGGKRIKSKIWIPASIILGALLLTAGWFGYPLLTKQTSTPTPRAEASVPASPTAQITAQAEEDTTDNTDEVEEPVTSQIPDWAKEAAEPILTTIQNNPPYFADDFNQLVDQWFYESSQLHSPESCPSGDEAELKVTDGTLNFIISPRCPQITAHNLNMEILFDYALQVDINFQGNKEGILELELRYPEHRGIGFTLRSWGGSNVIKYESVEDFINWDKNLEFDNSQPVEVLIIHTPPMYFVYLNSTLVYALENLETNPRPGNIVIHAYSQRLTDTISIEFDNLKLWELDMIDN